MLRQNARATANSVFSLVLAMGLIAVAVQAATVTWSATPVSGNWSVGANWVGGTPPNSGDDLVFPATSTIKNTTNDLPDGITINSITLDGNGYRLSGHSISLMAPPGTSSIDCTTGAAPGTNVLGLPISISRPASNQLHSVDAVGGCILILSGAIGGSGGLATDGGGTVVLAGDDSYTDNTAVAGTGITLVDGTLSASEVSTQDPLGGTVGGSGTITNTLALSLLGNLRPGQGQSSGILHTGNLSIGGASSYFVKLNGLEVGTQYDQVSVTGPVFSSGSLSVSLGFVPPSGAQFTIIKNDGGSPVSGTFAGLPEGATFVAASTTFQISYVGGDGNDVVLTVISPWVPTALAVDASGNGVMEAGELATLQPTWMNSSGSSSTLTGATTNFTGPAGPTYSNPDTSGSYGTLADGTSAQCTDCYTIQVSGTRPAQHWDATIDETMTPSSTVETWKVHVGESFPDVPTSQQFYKFIENLFHNGITGGCAGGNYCTDGSTTRAQMAVFLLKGEHGSGYVPPPCAGVFPDVPCPSQFADWIEELHAEGITEGCGGGMYCPANPVTRGQMAPFLLKAQHGGSYVPPVCSATVFTDVPCPGAQFVNFINQLSVEGITGGCGGGKYCPSNPNTRGQMAVFLVKTFGLQLYRP